MPFLGTALGAGMVFLMKKDTCSQANKFLTAIASGVMLSASFFSLIMPAIEMCEGTSLPACVPTCVGFSVGVGLLLIIDHFAHKLENKSTFASSVSKKNSMLLFAITIHNIPEGMAVGAALAGALAQNTGGAMVYSALILSLGIAIQNFPEGAIISLPLNSENMSKPKAFLYGVLSGAVEPIFAVITLLLTSFISSLLPYLLSFAAGAMLYVVVAELIPDSQEDCPASLSTIGLMLGFVVMMLLDLSFG